MMTVGVHADTQWTGAANNNLWADPLNWSSGVPTADSTASIQKLVIDQPIPIDLGGQTRPVGTLKLFSPYVQFSNGAIAAEGTLAPGPARQPGRFTIHQVGRANLEIDLAGHTPGVDYDQLVVLDTVDQLVALTLNLSAGFTPVNGDTFLILDNRSATPLTATFENLPEGATLQSANTLFQISYTAGDGNDIALTVVPEPTPLALIGTALPLLRRRPRKRPMTND